MLAALSKHGAWVEWFTGSGAGVGLGEDVETAPSDTPGLAEERARRKRMVRRVVLGLAALAAVLILYYLAVLLLWLVWSVFAAVRFVTTGGGGDYLHSHAAPEVPLRQITGRDHAAVEQQLNEMLAAHPGACGFSAINAGHLLQMVALRDDRGAVLYNPQITGRSGLPVETVEATDLCSSNGTRQSFRRQRYPTIEVRAHRSDESGPRLFAASGLRARCLEHHLEVLSGAWNCTEGLVLEA